MADLLSGAGTGGGLASLGTGLMNYISGIQSNRNARAQNATTDKWGPLLALNTHGGGTPQLQVPKASFAAIMGPALSSAINAGAGNSPQTGIVGSSSNFSDTGSPMAGGQGEDLNPAMMSAAGGGKVPMRGYAGGGQNASTALKMLPMIMMAADGGGQVPGQAKVYGDSPMNDTQLTATSPGEVILPRSVSKAGMNGNKWKVAAYMNEVKKHGPGPMPIKGQNYSTKQDKPQSNSMSPWKAMAGGGKVGC